MTHAFNSPTIRPGGNLHPKWRPSFIQFPTCAHNKSLALFHNFLAMAGLDKSHWPMALEYPSILIGQECHGPWLLRLHEGDFGPQPVTFLVDEKCTWDLT
jgi:hypothetical protein